MSPQLLLQQIKNRYPVEQKTIPLITNQIRMAIIDDPDKLLDTLSKEDQWGTLHLPYWTYLWPSAIGLARYIDMNDGFEGQRILEIGCGFGLAGIVACQKGGTVLFTDYELDTLTFAQYNALQNGGTDHASFVQMDWNNSCLKGEFSRILASDVVYEDTHWNPILALLQTHLAPNGEAIFAEPNRTSVSGFLERVGRYGFTYTTQTDDVVGLDGVVFKISIYCLKRDE